MVSQLFACACCERKDLRTSSSANFNGLPACSQMQSTGALVWQPYHARLQVSVSDNCCSKATAYCLHLPQMTSARLCKCWMQHPCMRPGNKAEGHLSKSLLWVVLVGGG